MRPAGWALIAAAALSGCAALDPYETLPAPAPGAPAAGATAGTDTAAASGADSRVAICYNTLVTSLAEVKTAAQAQCPADTAADPVETDWRLQYCPLLLPARATFVCRPGK